MNPSIFSVAAIKNKPVRNEDPKDAKLREYQAEIERLRALILRRKAGACEKLPRARRERPLRGRPPTLSDNCESARRRPRPRARTATDDRSCPPQPRRTTAPTLSAWRAST